MKLRSKKVTENFGLIMDMPGVAAQAVRNGYYWSLDRGLNKYAFEDSCTLLESDWPDFLRILYAVGFTSFHYLYIPDDAHNSAHTVLNALRILSDLGCTFGKAEELVLNNGGSRLPMRYPAIEVRLPRAYTQNKQ